MTALAQEKLNMYARNMSTKVCNLALEKEFALCSLLLDDLQSLCEKLDMQEITNKYNECCDTVVKRQDNLVAE
jgi:hypothetical protein